MESLRALYRIGHGPSSSHTMAPRRAAEIFKDRFPQAHSFSVTLYGSLAATGQGHLTDQVIIDAFGEIPTQIQWRSREV
jgi:L-serine dehydratase